MHSNCLIKLNVNLIEFIYYIYKKVNEMMNFTEKNYCCCKWSNIEENQPLNKSKSFDKREMVISVENI